MNEYVSPLQGPGHDGPCHDMKSAAEQQVAEVVEALAVPIKIVAYEGEGLTLVSGEYEVPPPRIRADGRPVLDVGDVKRALARWLREVADDVENSILEDEQSEQQGAAVSEDPAVDGDPAAGT